MVRILIWKIERYAKKNNIPIMQKDGIKFLTKFIKDNNITSILEIGSAIGYSAIRMALVNKNIKVTTVERDTIRYNEAVKNIKKFKLGNRITIINDDAFNVELSDTYDLIFIDAAKSQYTKFFLKFKKNLRKAGVIVSDNLKFHGFVDSERIKSRNLRQLVRKIKEYREFLENNTEFNTEFFDIGDGIGISRWKNG